VQAGGFKLFSILGERAMEQDCKSFVLTNNVHEDLPVLLPWRELGRERARFFFSKERERELLIEAVELETGSKITRTTYARFIMHRTHA